MSSLSACPVCAKHLAPSYFMGGASICSTCQTLDPDTAVQRALAVERAKSSALAEIASGDRDAKRAKLRALIALHGKRCTACHWYKPAAEYSACEPRPDGLQTTCRACAALRVALSAQAGGVSAWHSLRDALRLQAPVPQA